MTKSTANSDYPVLPPIVTDKNGLNIEDPHADLQLTEQEIAEIFSRP